MAQPAFLGTIAGNQTQFPGVNQQPTYGRQYETFMGSDDLRKTISWAGESQNSVGDGYKLIGDAYAYTPSRIRSERKFDRASHGDFILSSYAPQKHRQATLQGGGYFITVKTYENNDPQRYLNCFAYALGTFGETLENLAGIPMTEIQKSVDQEIDSVVRRYFVNVDTPIDGDLVVCSVDPGMTAYTTGGTPVTGTTHAGIYRNTQQNWHSPTGGTVESKWGWLGNRYVFQHDVFFVPHFYGNRVKFYRPRQVQ